MTDTLSKPAHSIYDQVLRQLAESGYTGPNAYQLWHPPLEQPAALNTLLHRTKHAPHQHLRLPVGIIDEPLRHRQDVWHMHLDGINANAAIAGSKSSGKSTLLLTLMMAGAATHSPRDLQFYCLDFSSSLLIHVEDLPHVGSVATADQEALVRRTIAELTSLLEFRRTEFKRHRIVNIKHYRSLRNDPTHPVSQDPYGDAVLIIDGWNGLKADEYEALIPTITTLAETGPGFGIHVVITTTRWSDLRASIRDHLGLIVEMHPATTDDVVLTQNRQAIKSIPHQPGRAMSSEYLHLMIAAPRLDGHNTMDGIEETYTQSCTQIAAQWPTDNNPPAPIVRTLPDRIHIDELLRMAPTVTPDDDHTKRWTIPIGLAESTMQPITADLAEFNHLLIFGSAKTGRSSILRAVTKAIITQNSPKQAAFIVIDYRSRQLGVIPDEYLLPGFYLRNPHDLERANLTTSGKPTATEAERIRSINPDELLAHKLATRRPPEGLSIEQLRARSWWDDYDIVLLIDDWDLVTQAHSNSYSALMGLTQFVSAASDVGFHVIATCQMKSANSVLTRGLIKAAYDLSSPTILLSGDKTDFPSGRAFSVTKRPPGQALYKTDDGLDVIQAAYSDN